MTSKDFFKKFGLAGFAFFLLKGLVWLGVGGAALVGLSSKNNTSTMTTTPSTALKVAVYDTYVRRKQGGIMHFDILVDAREQDIEKIHAYGREYLSTKGQAGQPLTAKECRFCHIENAKGPIEAAILKKGYYIIEMEGCD